MTRPESRVPKISRRLHRVFTDVLKGPSIREWVSEAVREVVEYYVIHM